MLVDKETEGIDMTRLYAKRSDAKIKRLVAFVVLMESGEGVTSKSPSYLLEKYEMAMMTSPEYLPSMLDHSNRAKYEKYLKEWIVI